MKKFFAAIFAPIAVFGVISAYGQGLMFPGPGTPHTTGGGGGGNLPSALTVIEPTSNAQTNMPFTMGIPMLPGTLDGSHSIQVNDGATTLNCDENNRASDLSPSVRFVSLTCIIPSATSGEVKQLVPTVVSGAPATGTDITVSDIAAAFTAASSYDVPVTFTNINGVSGTWTASLATALASGNSGWVDTSHNTVMGKYRSGGGLVTEYIVFAPAFKSGVADPQVHVTYDVVCYKANRAAVSGGNPILGCKIDPIIENSYIQESSAVDDYYGLSVGTGGSVASFPNSTPSINLTLAQSAAGANVAITASSSLFTANSIGQVIANGTGVAVINGYTDATHAQVVIYSAFSSTSVGSGTYTLYGINHPFPSQYKFETFFGFAHNPPTVDSGKVYIGAAWNNGALTGGPGSYLVGSKMLPNWSFSNSGYTNDLTQINLLGTNPMGYIQGGGAFGAGGHMGDILLFLETSGQSPMIGIVPDWDVKAIFRYDSNAAPVIFGNANRWATLPVSWKDQNTGLNVSPCNAGTAPSCAGSTNWVMFSVYAGTAVPVVSNPMTPWSMDAFAHDPDSFYVAALMTGDFYWLENLQMNANAAPMWINFGSTGLSRVQYTDPQSCCGLQERGAAWSFRTILDATLMTPDTTPSVLGISKTVMNTWAQNQVEATTYGFKTVFLDNTGIGSNFWGTDGPHYTQINDHSYPQFEAGYASIEWAHAFEQGMLTANGVSARNWWLQNQVNMINDTTQTSAPYVIRWQYGHLYDESSSCPGTHINTWGGTYNSSEYYWIGARAFGIGQDRNPAATLTLSGTSGSSISATLSGGNYLTTTAFYVGAWVSVFAGGNLDGIGQITAVADANHFTMSTVATHDYYRSGGCNTFTGQTFGSTSYSNTNISLPAPAPGDPVGTDFATYLATGGGDGGDYFQIVQIGTLYAKEYGLSGGASAYSTIYGYNGGNFLVAGQPYKWQIALR